MNPINENEKFNWQQQVKNNPNFCILPFIHAYVGTTGEVNLCCSAEHPPSDWRADGQTEPLDKIWTGDTYQAIRESFLNGERVSHCRRCWDADDRGGGSDRQTHNTWFRPPADFDIDVVQGNTTGKPTFLDLRPGNFCNLACRMCFTRISSRVNDQHRDHPEMEAVTGESYWHEVNDWLDDPVKFETVKQWIPTTKTLKLAGGEPLFMPGVIRLLRWCVENGHTHMHLDITTNGTRTQGKILSWLTHFDSVDIQLSIDGVGAVNDYIRVGSNWTAIDRAYQTYLGMNLRVNLLATVQLYNAYDLVGIVEYWNQHGAQGNLVFNFVDWPRDLQIDLLPLTDRLDIAEQLEAVVANIPADRRQQFRMDATLHRLRNSHLSDSQVAELRTKWIARTDMMDQINHADLSQIEPRLSRLRDEWRR